MTVTLVFDAGPSLIVSFGQNPLRSIQAAFLPYDAISAAHNSMECTSSWEDQLESSEVSMIMPVMKLIASV